MFVGVGLGVLVAVGVLVDVGVLVAVGVLEGVGVSSCARTGRDKKDIVIIKMTITAKPAIMLIKWSFLFICINAGFQCKTTPTKSIR